MHRQFRSLCRAVFLAPIALACFTLNLHAAESGIGIYLLGAKGPQAAVLPPPGVFKETIFYSYVGKAEGDLALEFGGNIAVGADVAMSLAVPTLFWVPELTIAGGRLGFFGLLPVGQIDVQASAILTGPGGAPIVGATLGDTTFTVGDPQAGAVLGWNSGNLHWNVGFLANVPIGDYDSGDLANLSFNRWAIDVNGAATWLDPQMGVELSTAIGVTFNGENPATNYKTGEEFHIEFAALHHISQEFNWGLVGYHYEQISGDSGSGALLGSFKGRVTAIGPHLGFTLPINGIPIGIRARFYTEMNVKNRLEGNGGFVTVTIPLFIAQPPPQAAQ